MPNSELIDKYYTCRVDLVKKLKAGLAGHNQREKGYELASNIINNPRVSYAEMKKLKHFFSTYDEKNASGKLNNEDIAEYKLVGGDEMKAWTDNTLKNSRDSIYFEKESRMKAGDKNQFIKHHNKDSNANPTTVRTPMIKGDAKSIESGKADYVLLGKVKEEVDRIKEIMIIIETINK
jgi:hypothetical protein